MGNATALADYRSFLEAKQQLATQTGLDVALDEVSPVLKPHQRDAVVWAVRGGRRAVFASFGLGKTLIQLEIVRLVLDKLGGGRGLIVLPLGVRQEFARDAKLLGLTVTFIRTAEEAVGPGIYTTNYESVREGKLDPTGFDVVSLDEAAILRGFGGTKTFREFMRLYEGTAHYRFVATATPSPNEYIELLAYAAFLDVMDVGQAKTRFFKRDSTKADKLTLLPHMEREFWLWVASWALFLQKPSDLGYSDEGYELPPIEVHWHEVASDTSGPGDFTADGRGLLFRDASMGVQQAAAEKRDSLDLRVAKMREIIDESPDDHFLLWHDLEAERHAIEDALPATIYDHWWEFKDGNSRALELYERHYSARQYADGRERTLFVGPGEKTVLLTQDSDALFAWRKFKDDSGQEGVCCAVFRNEGPVLSSDLIREAMAIAWLRWPGERLYTYVDPDEVESSNPGYCFIQAGWTKAGFTKGGLVVLEALPDVDVPDVTPQPALRTVWGSQDLDERERRIIGFSDGEFRYLATKPVIAGSGCNFQRHCHRAIFVGIGFKFADFIQAVHRIHRFLQGEPVRIDLIYTEAERGIKDGLVRKWEQHDAMVARMGEIIRTYGLSHEAISTALNRSTGVERVEVTGDRYRLVNNDAVEETAAMESDSVDLIVTSIPFATQYEYTPSYNDFGHTDDNGHFWEQMDFLTPELLRVLAPGRVAVIHVKDRIVPGGMTGLGFQTVQAFHAEAIAHYQSHGFAYLGMKTIVTDVVRENNQTYRLGWTEQCKDGSRMGVGMPEYLLILRKPPTDSSNGYADVPVVKSKEEYSRTRWQIDAHGFARSNGDRPLLPEEIADLPHEKIFKLFRNRGLTAVYDFDEHVALGEALEAKRRLPTTFMLLQPASWHPDVWTDVARMRTLNMLQERKGQQQHLCPLQFDIVDRLITQFSMEGETVYDPFGGLMTVPYCAVKLGRRGVGVELNPAYFADGVVYVEAAAREASVPTLFDLVEAESIEEAAGAS